MQNEKGKQEQPSVSRDFVADIAEQLRENEAFLEMKAKETYSEAIDLIMDAIDYSFVAVKRGVPHMVESSISFFLNHILMPLSYAVYLDLLAGNLLSCFMQIRFMLESLARCYIADIKFDTLDFFQEKLYAVEVDKLNDSKLMKILDNYLGLDKLALELWGKLSEQWVHPRAYGFVDRVLNGMAEIGSIPPWALIIPTNYSDSDLIDLGEVHKRISQFRVILNAAMNKYKTSGLS